MRLRIHAGVIFSFGCICEFRLGRGCPATMPWFAGFWCSCRGIGCRVGDLIQVGVPSGLFLLEVLTAKFFADFSNGLDCFFDFFCWDAGCGESFSDGDFEGLVIEVFVAVDVAEGCG